MLIGRTTINQYLDSVDVREAIDGSTYHWSFNVYRKANDGIFDIVEDLSSLESHIKKDIKEQLKFIIDELDK